MSGSLAATPAQERAHRVWPWIAAGLAALYLPSYWNAAQGLWQTDEFGHAPLILVIAGWLFWQARGPIALSCDEPRPLPGWLLLALGLAMYALGRTAGVSSVEFASQILVVASVLLLLKGTPALRAAWFAVFYLIFMVPLPGTLVDALTEPLKHWISIIVVDVLHSVGYPIGRTGVVITIGHYELLVADACSGLNSMFSLAALGALFIHLMGRANRVHSMVLVLSILPIAFAANIVRVTSLVLITYHVGDAAGQGYLHGTAGIVLMLSALAAFFALDWCLARWLPSARSERQ